jgi:hypothetical protein
MVAVGVVFGAASRAGLLQRLIRLGPAAIPT